MVSFIVATYHADEFVESFIRLANSFLGTGCEFIISDYGTSEEMLNKLKKQKNVRVVKSSPDKGIYDAWNYAIPYAKGEYFSFIGIDDIPKVVFYNAVKDDLFTIKKNPDAIYGDSLISRGTYKRCRVTKNEPSIFCEKVPIVDIPFPGLYLNARLFNQLKFDASYRLAADFKFLIQARRLNGFTWRKIDTVQVDIHADGLSWQPEAYSVYSDEYRRIEFELSCQVGYNILMNKVFGRIFSVPFIHGFLRDLSWYISHD